MKEHVQEIRAALTDPKALCVALGLTGTAKRQSNGVKVLCPNHGEHTPSCSVFVGPDGTIAVHCFGCHWNGDALRLIAKVHNLDDRTQFKEVLLIAAQIAGLTEVEEELLAGKPRADRPMPPPPKPAPERTYPPNSEVQRFWTECGEVKNEISVKRILEQRKLDPDEVGRYGLSKAITSNQWLPNWASYQGNTWRFTGHRLIIPVYDHEGSMLSVRAWDVEGKAEAKRLPPAGYKAYGLAMANRRAVEMLSQKKGPCRILVTEGEPDFLTASSKWFWLPVFGLVSGAWNQDFAKKIPMGSEVIVMTHHDEAGDKYAKLVADTVKNRAVVVRSSI